MLEKNFLGKTYTIDGIGNAIQSSIDSIHSLNTICDSDKIKCHKYMQQFICKVIFLKIWPKNNNSINWVLYLKKLKILIIV